MKGSEPAFPFESERWKEFSKGMTLRQFYAGLAMKGVLSNPNAAQAIAATGENRGVAFKEVVARFAVQHADALLAELEMDDEQAE